MSRSPDCARLGAKPTQGPIPFEDRKRSGVVDGGFDCQGYDCADAGHCHQRATDRICPGVIAQEFFHVGQFLPQRAPHGEDWFMHDERNRKP